MTKHEILFRGKRLDNGEWVEGDLIRHYENQRRFIACDQLAYTHTKCGIDRLVTERFHEVDPDTVGQFTGLLDKHGKKIWEGDRCKDGLGGIGTIEYEDGAFIIRYDESIDSDWTGSLLYAIDGDVEVIGIHDNTELMQGV